MIAATGHAEPRGDLGAGPAWSRWLVPTALRTDQLLLRLLVGVVAVRVACFLTVAGADLVGDEVAYVDGARAVSNLVRSLAGLHAPDGAEMARGFVGSGWFMPGMSIVLGPLFVAVPDAPIWMVRGYLGMVSTGLLVWAVVDVRRTFGRLAAWALLVVPGLVPMAAIFGASAWGDTDAGLVVVLLVGAVVRMVRGVSVTERPAPTWRHGVSLGLLAIAAVYLRSSVSLLSGGLLVATLALGLLVSVPGRRRALVVAVGAACLTFVVVLAPWSVYTSHVLGGRVLTTTTVPTVLANTFGDRDQVCFGPCDPGSSMWFSPLRYSRELARATGVSEVEALRQMSEYARRGVTPGGYADDVVRNARDYVDDPGRFARFVRWDQVPHQSVTVVRTLSAGLMYPMYVVGAATLLLVVRRGRDRQVMSIVLKLSLGALLTQPFVHISGSRYWTTLAPLLALGLALLWEERRGRASAVARPDHSGDAGGSAVSVTAVDSVLVHAQRALALGAVGIVVLVGSLARFG